jgi:hypothetical protein
MKKGILLLVAVFGLSIAMYSQVTIGSTSDPNGSAILDLQTGGANNQGLLLPKVQLESETDVVTVQDPVTHKPATGLMVYNTGLGGLKPAGVYVWNGSKWVTTADN